MAENWKDFLAGWIGGGTGIAFGQPLDTIRIRLQTQDSHVNVLKTKYTGAVDCFRKIVTNDGVMGLYRGLVPPLLTISLQNSILFTTYGSIKRFFEPDPSKTLSLTGVYFAGAGSGLACSFVTSPSELIKCRLQVQENLKAQKAADGKRVRWPAPSLHHVQGTTLLYQQQILNGPLDTVRAIVRQNGVQGLFKGFGITVLRDAPSYGIYFWCYESLQRFLAPPFAGFDQAGSKMDANLRTMIAGGFAGSISWGVIYPLDVLKSRLQTQPDHLVPKYTGIADCFARSVRAEGMGFLVKGLTTTIVRAFPVNAVTFLVYESSMELFNTLESQQRFL